MCPETVLEEKKSKFKKKKKKKRSKGRGLSGALIRGKGKDLLVTSLHSSRTRGRNY